MLLIPFQDNITSQGLTLYKTRSAHRILQSLKAYHAWTGHLKTREVLLYPMKKSTSWVAITLTSWTQSAFTQSIFFNLRRDKGRHRFFWSCWGAIRRDAEICSNLASCPGHIMTCVVGSKPYEVDLESPWCMHIVMPCHAILSMHVTTDKKGHLVKTH